MKTGKLYRFNSLNLKKKKFFRIETSLNPPFEKNYNPVRTYTDIQRNS